MKRLFEKAFTLPFNLDLWGNYVFDDNGQMVLQFNEDKTGWSDVGRQEQVIDWINDVVGTIKPVLGEIKYDRVRSCLTEDGHHWIEIRGWGHLTGAGGLNLPDIEAIDIQDDLANYIIEKLTNKA